MQKKISILLICIVLLFSLSACSIQISPKSDEKVTEISKEESEEILNNTYYLPIGTVIKVEGYSGKVMIIGVLQINGDDTSVLYDYSGVAYPEGLIDPKENFLFNKEQIKRVYFLGYQSDEYEDFQDVIKEVKEEFESSQ